MRYRELFRFDDDDQHIRRTLEDCINIIGPWDVKSEPRLKSLKALSQEFTYHDLMSVVDTLQRAAQVKLARHADIDTEYSRTVRAQTAQTLERFEEAVRTTKAIMITVQRTPRPPSDLSKEPL